ncbi:hypothetical protein EVAR_12168_1 [Eumeta japonica]|uniref:Uncharacterized protein n=1 Tax=Eumeta variegata TaxID=151549 RepID=A0A4C1UHS4_EUMVA|nr:hypothetical protein EVAR_12168_1 [Eumeta japonica]
MHACMYFNSSTKSVYFDARILDVHVTRHPAAIYQQTFGLGIIFSSRPNVTFLGPAPLARGQRRSVSDGLNSGMPIVHFTTSDAADGMAVTGTDAGDSGPSQGQGPASVVDFGCDDNSNSNTHFHLDPDERLKNPMSPNTLRWFCI